MKISFWENGWTDNGSIIVSDVGKEVLKNLSIDFQTIKLPQAPNGHSEPVYGLIHSDEPDDCSKDEFNQLVKQYEATVV